MQTNAITLTSSLIARFWKYVDKSTSPHGCWLWTAACYPNGYGLLGRDGRFGKKVLTHRLSWHIHHGEIPYGLLVLHNCPGGDNRKCVNPKHLWLGTFADNNHDTVIKGRKVSNPPKGQDNWMHIHPEIFRGENNPNSKLNDETVRQIRATYESGGLRQEDVAIMFNTSPATVWRIVNRIHWKHVV